MQLPKILEVTQADIDHATALRPFSPDDMTRHCVVAQALTRLTGKRWEVGVTLAHCRSGEEDTLYLSPPVSMYIMDYMIGNHVGPSVFTRWCQVSTQEPMPV